MTPRVSVSEGEATIVYYSPDKIIINTQTKIGGLLVLRDAYYPNWQVSIDGQKTTIQPVNNLFRGVNVPIGKHTVVFSL